MALYRNLADRDDSKLMSQNNHLIGVWMSGLFTDQRWGEVRKQKGH